ncbi:Gp19/Gp15/Gp42 family protein [Cellulomonas iranensis]|uniref:Gp19/Gp15/Gp42 family protein n=1 Tax=Cellulomonas iranensis TaxID=76862 RepID=UPI000B3D1E66|nr:Gp19/Gp15/Gp42 family protein [Cellulomonas iranensis]
MLKPFAQPADIASVWRPLTSTEHETSRGLLLAASNRLRLVGRELGVDVDELIEGDDLLAAAAQTAVVNAAIRVLKNPDSLRQYQRSETTGPFTESEGGTYDNTVSAGVLYLDPADLLGLLPVVEDRGRVGTIRLGAGLA